MSKKPNKHDDEVCACARSVNPSGFSGRDVVIVAFVVLLIGFAIGISLPGPEPEPEQKLIWLKIDDKWANKFYCNGEWYYTDNGGSTWCDSDGIPVTDGPIWPWQVNCYKLNEAFKYQKGLERGSYLIEKFNSNE